MAVIGVLIQAQVGHQDRVLAQVGSQVGERQLDDAGRAVGR